MISPKTSGVSQFSCRQWKYPDYWRMQARLKTPTFQFLKVWSACAACVDACVHANMHVWAYVCVYMCVCVCACVCARARACACMCVCVCVVSFFRQIHFYYITLIPFFSWIYLAIAIRKNVMFLMTAKVTLAGGKTILFGVALFWVKNCYFLTTTQLHGSHQTERWRPTF